MILDLNLCRADSSFARLANTACILALLFVVTSGCKSQEASRPEPRKSAQVVEEPLENAAARQEFGRSPSEPPMSLSDMVDRFDDAVVFITVSDALGNDIAVGTGCIIDRSGLVATNRHVIEYAVSARVQLRDGSRLPVSGCMAVDESHDLAIIQVDGLPESMVSFTLGTPPELRPGDSLVAIGHPSEFRFTVSNGILSAIRRTEELPALYQQGLHLNPQTKWLQTTAAISNGSSGGPLLTHAGDLVGINTWVAEERDLGFAVSVEHLMQLRQEISSHPQPLPLPDAPVIVGSKVASLARDYQGELQSLALTLQAASDEDAVAELIKTRNPGPTYLAKCASVMQESESVADKVDALLLAHEIWSNVGLRAGRRHLVKLYQEVDEHVARSKPIGRAILRLGRGHYGSELSALLRMVMKSHPQNTVRARAGLALLQAMAADYRAARFVPEQLEILERLQSRFPDEGLAGTRLDVWAEERLIRLRSLSVGSPAQSLAGRDHLGAPLRLSDQRGKVVLLDFWSDGSPQCRVMYPRKRKLAEQLQDRPFAVLGVNCDESSGRLESLITSGEITWNSVYDGPQGRIAAAWLVEDLPTMFVLDSHGVIRYADVQEQQLEDAVHALLEEHLVQLPRDVLPLGSPWKWAYRAERPPADWTQAGFDDSSWRESEAPLGFGDSRVNTPLDYGDVDNKHPTACFRRTFHLNDPSSCARLICELDADDGAIVYLNGTPVLRTNVPGRTSWSTPALRPAAKLPLVVELDPQHLVAGSNQLAVEVHLVEPTSADLFFDLSLSSSGLDSESILTAKSSHSRIRFCQLAAQLVGSDGGLDEALSTLESEENDEVATWATVARITRAANPHELPLPEVDEPRRLARAAISGLLNSQAWEVVVPQDGCVDDVRRACRQACAAWRLSETTEAVNAGGIANTYAVALFRAGRFAEAITFFRKSMELQGENAADLAYMSVALRQLGEDDKALAAFTDAAAFATHAPWLGDDIGAAALEEARTEFHSPNER